MTTLDLVPQGTCDTGCFGQRDKFLYRFSTVVFASWDFHLTDFQAAANLRRSIRQQLQEMLNDATDADTALARRTVIISYVHKVRGSSVAKRCCAMTAGT